MTCPRFQRQWLSKAGVQAYPTAKVTMESLDDRREDHEPTYEPSILGPGPSSQPGMPMPRAQEGSYPEFIKKSQESTSAYPCGPEGGTG